MSILRSPWVRSIEIAVFTKRGHASTDWPMHDCKLGLNSSEPSVRAFCYLLERSFAENMQSSQLMCGQYEVNLAGSFLHHAVDMPTPCEYYDLYG